VSGRLHVSGNECTDDRVRFGVDARELDLIVLEQDALYAFGMNLVSADIDHAVCSTEENHSISADLDDIAGVDKSIRIGKPVFR
jgi:hypothetical protein